MASLGPLGDLHSSMVRVEDLRLPQAPPLPLASLDTGAECHLPSWRFRSWVSSGRTKRKVNYLFNLCLYQKQRTKRQLTGYLFKSKWYRAFFFIAGKKISMNLICKLNTSVSKTASPLHSLIPPSPLCQPSSCDPGIPGP